ncbi:hypothetical protein MKY91_08880 [Alkalicoccobacillus gibsonii]|uniref:Uncharacterized protein n=1 Tax=Alkalicoccobacillus gibsonii TaxID=79881 RepID=A0ABU9VH93_9BACI
MNPVVIYPEITLLTIDQSDKTVRIQFAETSFMLPEIGPRPPYYTNPKIEPVYPVV